MNVAVYCASSPRIHPDYFAAARAVGAELARRGATVVCGGGCAGLMAAVTDGALEAGGRATGVIPQFMVDKGWDHKGLTRRIITPDMHTRKSTMLTLADAVIALPGGIGTFEELFEAMTWRQLNLWSGNIVILNARNYYDGMLAQLERAHQDEFMFPSHRALFAVAAEAAEAVDKALAPAPAIRFVQKITGQDA